MRIVKTLGVFLMAMAVSVGAAVAQQEQQQDPQQQQDMQMTRAQAEMQRTVACMMQMRLMTYGVGPQQLEEMFGVTAECPHANFMEHPSPAAWVISMRQELNLDEDQIRELADQDSNFRRDQVDRRAELERSIVDLGGELNRIDPDSSEIESALDGIADAENEIIASWFEARENAFDELDEDQRQRIDTAIQREIQQARARLFEQMEEAG